MKCLDTCKELDVSCPVDQCRSWIPYEKEYNCLHETLNRTDSLTLREIAERMNLSFVRIKQIQDKAVSKIKKSFKE